VPLHDVYDYTTKDWYALPMASGDRWSDPYFDEAVQT
jgi:hypothetical protein